MVWRICENESYQSKIPGYHGVTEMDWCEKNHNVTLQWGVLVRLRHNRVALKVRWYHGITEMV